MRKPLFFLSFLSATGFCCSVSPAFAQRTNDNATTQAEDAFGATVGDEQIGIYNPGDVRGFSPIEAGNVRLEGLYFDLQADLNGRLIESSAVRVGLAAQTYPFPAPTGIADYAIRTPRPHASASGLVRYGPFGTRVAELDANLPLTSSLGVAAGVDFWRERFDFGGTPHFSDQAITLSWKPTSKITLLPFWSHDHTDEDESRPRAITVGDFLPPRVKRGIFAGQPWSDYVTQGFNFGTIALFKSGGIDLEAGVFRSLLKVPQDFNDVLVGVTPDGHAADRLLIADKDNRFGSFSGEVKGTLTLSGGPRIHRFLATLRAREQKRRYGGSDIVSLGPSIFGVPDFHPEPPLTFGPKSDDDIRQWTVGMGYEMAWRGLGRMNLGVQKTDYRKQTSDPASGVVTSKSSPLLINAAATLTAIRNIEIYAAFTRGLEEAPVAPEIAINHSEAPPAINTQQEDAGIRWKITPRLNAIVGLFNIEKPYFNLDSGLRFRSLGSLRHKGIELSLSGELLPGLSVVAGAWFLDARVSGEEVQSGKIGKRPVGSLDRTTVVSLDYRPSPQSPVSGELTFAEIGKRVANASNTLVIAPRTAWGIGGRYRLSIGRTKMSLHAVVDNIFNTFGYDASSSEAFTYNTQRRFTLSAIADF